MNIYRIGHPPRGPRRPRPHHPIDEAADLLWVALLVVTVLTLLDH